MSLYIIRHSTQKGNHMAAQQEIKRGTLILEESPLANFSAERKDRFSEEDFWSTRECSGAVQVFEAYNKLSLVDQMTFQQLEFERKTDAELDAQKRQRETALTTAQWECLSRIQTDSFKRIVRDADGTDKVVFTVFDQISRFNHSCRPNAWYEWDPNRHGGQGTIHALERIPSGHEITISYFGDLDFALCSRSAYEATKHLETARTLHGQIVGVTAAAVGIPGDFHFLREVDEHVRHSNNIRQLGAFITALKNIEIKDVRLGEAYRLLGDYHRAYMSQIAEATVHLNCQRCIQHGHNDIVIHPRAHLDEATKAYKEEKRVHIICYGERHWMTLDTQSKIDELDGMRAPYNSPTR